MSLDPDTNVFELSPWRAGLEGGLAFGKMFLVTALLAMPFALFRDDWTWLQFLQAFAVSIAMGFFPLFTGALLWHSIGEVPYLRTAACSILPIPLGTLPCLVVFAPEAFKVPLLSHLVASWLLLAAALCTVPPLIRIAWNSECEETADDEREPTRD